MRFLGAIMDNLISICIPTYNRLPLLQETIASCLTQKYRPLEIVIGDNSTNDITEEYLQNLVLPDNIELRYFHNRPTCGPAMNVNRLFDAARGGRLLLIHDDDLLCEGGLDILVECWEKHPSARCVYGNQYLISQAGLVLPQKSEELNVFYSRSKQFEGPQTSCLESGLRQQVPNNGYLVETALARQVRYRTEAEVGHSVDTDFGIRLGAAVESGAFVYVNEYVSKNRENETSIMRLKSINHGQHLFYREVEKFPVSSPGEVAAKQELLDRIGAIASLDAAMAKDRKMAFHILFSRHYGKPIFSHWTLFRLLSIISPNLGMAAGRLARRS